MTYVLFLHTSSTSSKQNNKCKIITSASNVGRGSYNYVQHTHHTSLIVCLYLAYSKILKLMAVNAGGVGIGLPTLWV